MANTAKISLKNDRLCAESSDLLKKAKEDSKTKALLQIMPYQIRTEINLASADLSMPKQAAAVGAARNEASRFEDALLKMIKELVQKLEKLQDEDRSGNDKAGDQAEKAVKECSDEIDDSLPDFGTSIRKAVEQGISMKLASSCKSVSSGAFRGLKLVAKFKHGGVSAETLKDFQDAAKSLDTAGESAIAKGKEDKKALETVKQSVKEKLAELKKAVTAKDEAKLKELLAAVPESARALVKEFEGYYSSVEAFDEMLSKTDKGLAVESKELGKDLSKPEFRTMKAKFDQTAKELQELRKAVDKRLKDTKYVIDQFREADRLKTAQEWELRLAVQNRQVAGFVALDATKFNKAAEEMLIESKKRFGR